MSFSFTGSRTDYSLTLSASGTIVKGHGLTTTVPYGDAMSFGGDVKYSKDTASIVDHITSHIEIYQPWEQSVDLPVDFLRTGAYWTYSGETPFLPDRAGKVIVAYVNSSEYTDVGGWDPSFKAEWDKNGDHKIDAGVTNLPAYVDTRVFNSDWNNYVAKYWDPSWLTEIEKKVDLVASEGFDGVMLDVMTPYYTWLSANLGYSKEFLRQGVVDLFKAISQYAKGKYGDAFVISANIDNDAKEYFPDIGKYVDVGYYQNAFLDYTGSGDANPYGAGTRALNGDTSALKYLTDNGISVLTMEQLGTGQGAEGAGNFQNYDDRATQGRFMELLLKAQQTGVLPYLGPLYLSQGAYALDPRFARVDAHGVHAGTVYADYVLGSTGNDSISGGAADDAVTADAGNDTISGDAGNDNLLGGTGADLIYGGDGNDHLWGENLRSPSPSDGGDTLSGGAGSDYLQGNAGADSLDGGDGSDRIYGGKDNDTALGGAGNDTINGNLGDDSIDGGTGNDSLRGGQGNDVIKGGDGDDQLSGDLGADTLSGGAGADIFYFSGSASPSSAPDRITDYVHGTDHLSVGYLPGAVLTGAAQSSAATAASFAQQLFADHTGDHEVAAVQVGGDTYLFFSSNAGASADSAVILAGVTASTIVLGDFL